METLNTFECDVLAHTSRTGRYVTGEPAVIEMANRGILHDHGPQSLAGGDHYLVMTQMGRQALMAHNATLPKPALCRKLARSQERYRSFLNADSELKFGEWIKTRYSKP